jgi:hypothetical protein
MSDPRKRQKLSRKARKARAERNARRGRTPAYIKAKNWAVEQERKRRKREKA